MVKLIKVPSRSGQIIYGPIHSRRIGVDIGINLLTQKGKTCNYDCLYCQYGKTKNLVKESNEIEEWISKNQVLTELEDTLKALSESGYHLDAVTFSGFGEPTLHPKFDLIVTESVKIRDKYYPKAKLTLITNSSNLNKPDISKCLRNFDHVIAKLDTAINESFHKINRPSDPNLDVKEIIETLKSLSGKIKRLTIQVLLFDVLDLKIETNTTQRELLALRDAICYIKPDDVQIYTIVREGTLSSVIPAKETTLIKLEKLINEKCGNSVIARVY
ncbi:MAG: radical SAM protein [Candidatus Odinarchaeia archaeon]